MTYVKRGINSFNLLRKNLVLFVPDLIYLGIFLISSLMFLKLTGLLSTIINNLYNLEVLKNQFQTIISNAPILIRFLIILFIFIIINFVIGIGLLAIKFDMIKSLLKTKKINLKASLKNSKNYILNLILIKITIYLMVLIPLLIAILIQILFKQKILFIILLVLTALFYIYLVFSLFFVYPTVFFKTKKIIEAIKQSFSYFHNNKKHTFYTLLMVLIISIIITYFIAPIQYISSLAPQSLTIFFTIFFNILNILINKILNIWKEIFIFINYLKKD